ncbi:MAG: thiamine phosphate synthase [Micropruina sp.]|nr:thiamine phosphate synthase [Micropruina sp.]
MDTRLALARLLLISDTRGRAGDLEGFVDAALAGGVDIIQLRDQSASSADLLAALAMMRKISYRYQGLVSVFESGDLAREFDTDVLHLPSRGLTATAARAFLHEWAVIGRSCYSEADVDAALADPEVAYLTVGPVFGALGMPGHVPGLELVAYAAKAASHTVAGSKPWFAVGGITETNLDQVLAAGARRIAVSRAITKAIDPGAAATSLKRRLRDAWNDDPAMEKVVFDAFHSRSPFH